MKNALQLFQKISQELLLDEDQNPVARHIPSKELYKQLDLSLKTEPMDEASFEQVVRELVFATPRTATKGFSPEVGLDSPPRRRHQRFARPEGNSR